MYCLCSLSVYYFVCPIIKNLVTGVPPSSARAFFHYLNIDMPLPFGKLLGSFSSTLGPGIDDTIDPDLSRD